MTVTTPKKIGGYLAPDAPALVFVTPAQAMAWLEQNTENRSLRQTQVDTLTRDILAGAWQITGDSVKFDTRGILIDGQHRLWAIVNSEKTVPLFVIRNLPTAVRDVIDTGIKRSTADVITFAGGHGAGRVVPVARLSMAREDGYYASVNDRRRPPVYSNSEIIAYIETHPQLDSVAIRANLSYRAVGIKSTALWAYCLSVFDTIDPDLSIEFERSLVEMSGFKENDARATLLRWMRDARRSGVQATILLPRSMFAVFRVWNAWRNAEPLSKLQMGDLAPIPTPV